MRSFRFAIFLLCVTCVVSFAQSTQTPSQDGDAQLQLTAVADKSVYRLNETMKLETRLVNNSYEDVYFYRWDLNWNPALCLTLTITDSKGKVVVADFLMDSVSPPPRPADIYEFIRLEPGRFYGRLDEFKLNELITRPGEYDIHISFKSTVSDDYVRKFLAKDPIATLPLWSSEKPRLRAETFRITVK